jgi:ketosteroid isomerase-like protein
MRRWIPILLAAAMAAAPALAQSVRGPAAAPARRPAVRPDTSAARRGVEAANRAYLDAFRRGDAAAIAAVYDEDAVQFRPGGVYLRGRAALAADFARQLQRIRFINGTITSSSLWQVDDQVYDVGHYTFVFQPAGKDTLVERSRYLNIWRRQPDGTYRIWRDFPVPRE